MFSADFTTRLRNSIGIDGLISLIFGLLILFLPDRSAILATRLVAISFFLIGIFYLALTFSKDIKDNWTRVSHLVLAAIYIVAGVFLFIDAAIKADSLFIFVSVFVGITWVIEGLLGLSTIEYSLSKGWTIAVSILSIVAGVMVLSSPLRSARVLWWLLGFALSILGMFKIAFFFASRTENNNNN